MSPHFCCRCIDSFGKEGTGKFNETQLVLSPEGVPKRWTLSMREHTSRQHPATMATLRPVKKLLDICALTYSTIYYLSTRMLLSSTRAGAVLLSPVQQLVLAGGHGVPPLQLWSGDCYSLTTQYVAESINIFLHGCPLSTASLIN